ncbi:MAG: ComEA family DNA-binding protein, partial [Dehalococcoidia bacterium]|nr:ComEA family DNA-binding protein [Dehalococcoidia bacterium]
VNLVAAVRDGQVVHIPGAGEVPQRVNINTAEAWLLKALPGIGDTLAGRIIAYRAENGPFQEIHDLKNVEGIGTATFEKLKDLITVR